jgi:hypothetical protein
MNNFVSYDSGKGSLDPDNYSHVEGGGGGGGGGDRHGPVPISHITPETNKTRLVHSPESSLSTHSDVDPSPDRHNKGSDHWVPRNGGYFGAAGVVTRKRTHLHLSRQNLNEGAIYQYQYHYPPVPLTVTERKRLSDTLFFLSKEIPTKGGRRFALCFSKTGRMGSRKWRSS